MAKRAPKTLSLEKKSISSSETGSSHHYSQPPPQSPAENAIPVFQRIHTSEVILGLIHKFISINSGKNEGQNERYWDHPPVGCGVQPPEERGNSILEDSWINDYPNNQKFPLFFHSNLGQQKQAGSSPTTPWRISTNLNSNSYQRLDSLIISIINGKWINTNLKMQEIQGISISEFSFSLQLWCHYFMCQNHANVLIKILLISSTRALK